MRHDRNWPWLSEDGQSPEDYWPTPGNLYFAHGYQGFASLQRNGLHLWACHIAMLPGARNVAEFARGVLDDMAEQYGARKFMSSIPEDNRSAQILAMRCGFVREGRIANALVRNGRLTALVMYGVERCLMH